MTAKNFKDLTGQVFQYLTVIERTDNHVFKDGKIKVRWLCQCECGNKTVKYSSQLKNTTKVVSCGCKTPKPKCKYDLAGEVFGFLTVCEKSTVKSGRNYLWRCICECGNEVFANSTTLIKNEKKSCGCKTKAETSGTHGMYGTSTYKTWISMIERCTKEYRPSYDRYKDKDIDPKMDDI